MRVDSFRYLGVHIHNTHRHLPSLDASETSGCHRRGERPQPPQTVLCAAVREAFPPPEDHRRRSIRTPKIYSHQSCTMLVQTGILLRYSIAKTLTSTTCGSQNSVSHLSNNYSPETSKCIAYVANQHQKQQEEPQHVQNRPHINTKQPESRSYPNKTTSSQGHRHVIH